ncbi:MAG: hypothetical protein AAGC55_34490, partial [Myxococcota bacterium]
AGDAATMGALMNDSHASLRDDFEVSGRELDIMAECARAHDRCFGARMTGAGFAGCAVALIDTAAADGFAAVVAERYRAETGREARIYVCQPAAGVELLAVPESDAVSDTDADAIPDGRRGEEM